MLQLAWTTKKATKNGIVESEKRFFFEFSFYYFCLLKVALNFHLTCSPECSRMVLTVGVWIHRPLRASSPLDSNPNFLSGYRCRTWKRVMNSKHSRIINSQKTLSPGLWRLYSYAFYLSVALVLNPISLLFFSVRKY